ncbi:hypothetical protein NHX12_021911 [Muraenolepis orangiensis]|uniref:Uncharacterized protein n=1 Tax=Muraenolepis orangiensis TaxID=630683 RepID=A0A9Q0EUK8_9TELE|nr:hypothetical protein NHX12_021911 [Muraenolepis orangiensis]
MKQKEKIPDEGNNNRPRCGVCVGVRVVWLIACCDDAPRPVTRGDGQMDRQSVSTTIGPSITHAEKASRRATVKGMFCTTARDRRKPSTPVATETAAAAAIGHSD